MALFRKGRQNDAPPRVIHITANVNSEEPRGGSGNGNGNRHKGILQTPTKTSGVPCGILKPSSYHRRGASSDKNKSNSDSSNTPSTVHTTWTNDSNSSSTSTSSDSTETRSLDRIICNLHAKHGSTDGSSQSSSSARGNSSHLPPPSATNTITATTPREQKLREARIRHIEDLNERIKAAKARKLVERKAYRREDRLLLKLARELKVASKKLHSRALDIKQVEESNRFLEERLARTKQELCELRASRPELEHRLKSESMVRVANERSKHQFQLAVQDEKLESVKTTHQLRCQELCESVLDANFELDRLRGCLGGDNNKATSTPPSSPSRRRRAGTAKTTIGSTPERAQWWRTTGGTVLLVCGLAMVIAMALFVDGNGHRAAGKMRSHSVPSAGLSMEFVPSSESASLRESIDSAPKALPYSRILALEDSAAISNDLLAPIAVHAIGVGSTASPDETTNKSQGFDTIVRKELSVNRSISSRGTSSREVIEDGPVVATRNPVDVVSTDCPLPIALGTEGRLGNTCLGPTVERKRRFPGPNEFAASVARLVLDGTTLGTINRRE
ncbi:unnamed protein product [Pseudo-nitzschia multistriata]|uniref:Uncharacterized protein n=1 Tax=Pseudo-nitzschia multistriata TaxID=183589 RepID=A0A448ZAT7_9STRA|nr:unnamed protein product [Pseudo-nitzschia multistriata]